LRRRDILALLGLALAWAAPALALEPTPFLTQPVILALSPPAQGGAAEKADRDAALRFEKTRTPARVARAQADVAMSAASAFALVLGPGFTEARTPLWTALMARASRDSYLAVRPLKERYARPRPPTDNRALRPCVPVPEGGSNSFPSGHATWGAMTGALLAEAMPAKARALRERGRDFGLSRAVCGVHYLSDVEAGQRIGEALAQRLLADPGFRAAFAPAAAELRAALAQ
jgi:acid phosphatase (class A)